jgi:hypothetical protein
MQPAACAGKCQREWHIPDEIRNLKDKITEPNTDGLIAQHPIVDSQRGRDRMAKILPAHGTTSPSFEIFLYLLADHALRNRSEFGDPVARCRQRHAGTRAPFKRKQTVRGIAGR